MLKRRAEDLPATPVEMDGVRDVAMRVMVGRDDGAPSFAMRHFTVGPGGHTPRHAHNYEHEVYVVAGSGVAEQAGEHRPIEAGDVLYVAPNVIHQFRNESESPLEFLCMVPVSYDCGGGDTAPTPGS